MPANGNGAEDGVVGEWLRPKCITVSNGAYSTGWVRFEFELITYKACQHWLPRHACLLPDRHYGRHHFLQFDI